MATCLECSNEFVAQRSTAKFCSAACKLKWNRKQGGVKSTEKPIGLVEDPNWIPGVVTTDPKHIEAVANAQEIIVAEPKQESQAIADEWGSTVVDVMTGEVTYPSIPMNRLVEVIDKEHPLHGRFGVTIMMEDGIYIVRFPDLGTFVNDEMKGTGKAKYKEYPFEAHQLVLSQF